MPEIKFLHGNDISTANVPISAGTFYLDLEKNELWYDDPSGQNTTTHIRLFNDVYKQLEDLNYEQITINKFACTNVSATLQKGTAVSGTLAFDWSTSKVPVKLLVNNTQVNEVIIASQGTIAISNQTFDANKTYTLAAEDERTIDGVNYPNLNASTKSFGFKFLTPVLYGSFPIDQTINSNLLNNTETISCILKSNSATGEYKINCGEVADNRVSIFAYPAEWGDISMTVNGLGVQWLKMTISYTSVAPEEIATNDLLSFTPQTMDYNVYYGTNVGLGDLKVIVS